MGIYLNNISNHQNRNVQKLRLNVSEFSVFPTSAQLDILKQQASVLGIKRTKQSSYNLYRLNDFYVLTTEKNTLGANIAHVSCMNRAQANNILNCLFVDLV